MTQKKVARINAAGVMVELEDVADGAELRADQVGDLPPDILAPKGAWIRRGGAWLRRCAQLDPNGIFLGMVEVPPAEIGVHHLLAITECDNKPREYKWVTDASPKNPFGGSFQPLPVSMRPKENDAPSDQQLLYGLIGALEAHGVPLPAEAAPWRAWFEKTIEGSLKGKV